MGKVLITGVHGQLGRTMARVCADRDIEYEGRDIDTLDIGDAAAVDPNAEYLLPEPGPPATFARRFTQERVQALFG